MFEVSQESWDEHCRDIKSIKEAIHGNGKVGLKTIIQIHAMYFKGIFYVLGAFVVALIGLGVKLIGG